MTAAAESLPADLAGAHTMILAERAARIEAQAKLAEARAEAANARADLTSTEALIAHLIGDREAASRALRQPLGTQGAAFGADGAAA